MFAKGFTVFSIIILLFVGLVYLNSTDNNTLQKSKVMHTYLVRIPYSAGVCPYSLMSMTKGKLKVLNDPHCVCPYSDNASYMTARCKDVKSVIRMLPSSIQNKVEIKLIDSANDNTNSKGYTPKRS